MSLAIVKPKKLKQGDTVALLSVSNPVTEAQRLQCVSVVEKLGFKTVCGDSMFCSRGYLAGPDKVRADDVNKFFADRGVDGIFCVRGGEGANRLLPLIDVECAKNNPKVLLGYSDVTVLHIMLNCYANLCTFYGPMPYTEFSKPTFPGYVEQSLIKAIAQSAPIGEILPPEGDEPITPIAGGKAEGVLIGGCLSLISAMMGTDFDIKTDGAILIVEDIREQPYKYDRWLCQLRDAGKLEKCAGIAIGQCTDCTPDKKGIAMEESLTLEDIYKDILCPLGIPVIMNVPFGHGKRKATFPLGARAMIDGDNGRFAIIESALTD